MENKDFRERLRNGDAEYSPEKWQQMSQLLDNADSEKDKVSPLWLWLVFGLFTIVLVFIGDRYNSTNESIYESTDIEKIETSRVEDISVIDENDKLENENINEGDTKSLNHDNVSIKEDNKTQKLSNQSRVGLTVGSALSKNEVSDNLTNTSAIHTNLKNDEVGEKENESSTTPLSKLEGTIDSESIVDEDADKRIKSGISHGIERDQTTVQFDVNDASKLPETKDEKNAEEDGVKISTVSGIATNEYYVSLLDDAESDLSRNRVQEIRKAPSIYSGKYIFLQGGTANFNTNPGLHFGAGFMWDINKVLGIESQVGYSYGQDRNDLYEGRFEREWQVDFNLLVNLYLIRTRDFGFSFNLGAGHTIYRGTRIIGTPGVSIDERRSSGRNLQGGLSVNYRMNEHSIGLKYGAISYDDAVTYLSARYLYKF